MCTKYPRRLESTNLRKLQCVTRERISKPALHKRHSTSAGMTIHFVLTLAMWDKRFQHCALHSVCALMCSVSSHPIKTGHHLLLFGRAATEQNDWLNEQKWIQFYRDTSHGQHTHTYSRKGRIRYSRLSQSAEQAISVITNLHYCCFAVILTAFTNTAWFSAVISTSLSCQS